MKKLRNIVMAAAVTAASISGASAQQGKGKILVVLSSETTLPLEDGKTFETGYYLNELVDPAMRFKDANYELVFANPKGNTPQVAADSINKTYFGDSEERLRSALEFQKTLSGLDHPLTLRQAIEGGLDQYKAVFVPGGPAPMIDLMASSELGKILVYFHEHNKTTILLCHGPVALASATSDPIAYQKALRSGDVDTARKIAAGWPYAGYNMTIFSDAEEKIAAQYVFKGDPLFFPQDALQIAGGTISNAAEIWQPHAIVDRELITGQNPASDAPLMDIVLRTLKNQ
jgi:putative intracellular protease/amidase